MASSTAAADLITYDATVVTGLEKLAIRECIDKLSLEADPSFSLGHVSLVTRDRYDKLGKLLSVENIYVSLYKSPGNANLRLVNATVDRLNELLPTVLEECNWRQGLEVWMGASGFDRCSLETMLDRKPEEEEGAGVKPSFRVSCNRSGHHKFTSPEVCRTFGSLLFDAFHWPVSMKQFDFEVLLTVKDNALGVSICLSKESLFKRLIVNYGVTSLHGTIAFNMAQLANVQPGDIVCDPLCGSGVIPVETAHSWPQTFLLACDNYPVAIEKTLDNVRANGMHKSTILWWDSTRMPLKDGSVDVFITDLPFGKRLGSKEINKTLYPALFAEMSRCLRPSTGRMVLLTTDKTHANQSLHSEEFRQYCFLQQTIFLKVGNLNAYLFQVKRNGTPFEK
ncbi:THUMP domain-containing protein 3 [Tyrophagus putrescentiae]|nr:THUMP domain-containing protein 3 [Tyrophagus putrescentiae]